MAYHLFTSESVTEGHPDKVCDQISDAILDTILAEDPYARVACETLATTGLVLVSGEISTRCYVDIPRVVRQTLRKIGYSHGRFGFDADTCSVLTSIGEQSPDIALGVDKSLEAKMLDNAERIAAKDEKAEIGAGDQGMMFGYATNETPAMMPMPIFLAHALSRRLAEVRKSGLLGYLGPDGKTQVTVAYEHGKPKRVESVVVSTQHMPEISLAQIDVDLRAHVIKTVLPPEMVHDDMKCYINPTGRFVVGGPEGDTGLTGRKIIVDTYGGMAKHGGGAFSGKDPTKVDRSACYAARYIAKNIVAAGLADRCEIQLAYAIGVARPVSVSVDTFGTGQVGEDAIERLVLENFDLRPAAIIEELKLRQPIYQATAAYGHFGRLDLELPWERTDKSASLVAKV
ncbi:MAG: methionine adenosyltransferase [Peptococcaceae bacterium]|nr:methionine adenosyltransferase [Peptococcaceae bacterium]